MIWAVWVWIVNSELVVTHETARDHLASQSAPAMQVMGGGGGLDARVAQPVSISARMIGACIAMAQTLRTFAFVAAPIISCKAKRYGAHSFQMPNGFWSHGDYLEPRTSAWEPVLPTRRQ